MHTFACAESKDTGKPLNLCQSLDIPRTVDNFRFFAHTAMSVQEQSVEQSHPQHAVHYTQRSPMGVVGCISPWNLPSYLLSWKLAPALVTGNCVVAKPSELTPTTASLIAEASHAVGFPPGVLNIVHGYGNEIGSAITTHPDIKAISFTGGTHTGKLVATNCAPLFKKLSLELGGKNPCVVFDDVDIPEVIASLVRGAFLNSGQICLCGSRLYVHTNVFEKFVETFVKRVKSISVGNPMDEDTDVGPLVSLSHLEKVEAIVEDAREKGGVILCGGRRLPELGPGFYYEPTVILDPAPNSRAYKEEIFGPVVTIQKFTSETEAIEYSNSSTYGLAACVHTSDIGRAMRVSRAIQSGMVWVNTWLLRDLRTPFGGIKHSGLGLEGGQHSLHFFTQEKNITLAFNPSFDSTYFPPPPPMPGRKRVIATSPSRSLHTTTYPPTKAGNSDKFPSPVGAYVHARRVGRDQDLLFVAGTGPRQPGTNHIPGGPIRDPVTLLPLAYDVRAQTRAVIENVKAILEAHGSSLEQVVDVQCFLIDMDRDFNAFNEVYAEYFSSIPATRTTVAVTALPTPIAVELKVIATVG